MNLTTEDYRIWIVELLVLAAESFLATVGIMAIRLTIAAVISLVTGISLITALVVVLLWTVCSFKHDKGEKA